MSRAHALPEPLTHGAFHVSVARGLGVTASRLRARDLSSPTRGVRAASQAGDTTAGAPNGARETASSRQQRLRDELIARARLFAPALTEQQFFSHDTGLALIDAPLPYQRETQWGLHVSARRPAGQPRRTGVIGHRLQRRDPAPSEGRGLPIEHPARLWRQVAGSWELDDLIAAAEFLVCPRNNLLTLDDLRGELDEAGDLPGRPLERALREVRVGAETAEETKLRLSLTRAGLPEPEINFVLKRADGGFLARLDLAYPDYRVAAEHDGRTHAFDETQFARDADRWDAIRNEGWQHVRVLSHHMRPDPQVAVERVAQALRAAGWRSSSV